MKKQNNLEALTQKLNEQAKGNKFQDSSEENLWKPTLDKAGNGTATIRFLPSSPQDGEDALPWVKLFRHSFQGVGGWYIENCLSTLGKEDPVGKKNSELWNSGVEANKDIARNQKRKKTYISNVYVVNDPGNPENEGKVFKFRYGEKIFEMITLMMNGNSESGKIEDYFDEPCDPFNPFDFWKGANFKMKIKKVDKFSNYDSSRFSRPAPLLKDDAKLEEIWKQEYSLQELLDPKHFKSYEELEAKFLRVTGNTPGTHAASAKTAEETVLDTKTSRNTPRDPEGTPPEEDNMEQTLDYFRGLVEA